MRYADLVATSTAVAATTSRTDKVGLLAELLRQVPPDEVGIGVGHLSGVRPQRRLGVGYRTLAQLAVTAAAESTLSLAEVDAAFTGLAAAAGPGSAATRRDLLTGLLSRATEPEQRFLRDVITGNLRQGALDGVMLPAIATAYSLPQHVVRRAAMLAGFAAPVADRRPSKRPVLASPPCPNGRRGLPWRPTSST
ncbi:MAG: hypothetical protein ACK5MP_07010 [Nostocoides sp.]